MVIKEDVPEEQLADVSVDGVALVEDETHCGPEVVAPDLRHYGEVSPLQAGRKG